MRTKQCIEFEKHQSTWIYLLHHQAPPPQTRLLTEDTILPLSSLNTASSGSTNTALFHEQPSVSTVPIRRLLLPPPPCYNNASTIVVLNQDKTWTPSNKLLILSLPLLNDLRQNHRLNATTQNKLTVGVVAVEWIIATMAPSESGGLCYSHGGGRRCSLTWCSARAKKGGFCAYHLTGDRTPPSAVDIASTDAVASTTNALVHPHVVETLLSLAKDQSDVKVEQTTSLSSSMLSNGNGKSAYAIATLLN
ncbi:unnamed protein product [Peronospora belbahrii]|uniref:Uncharacterized protein n=1 Tax=Peronospora belbahrii TaxID=622444 RepID=A0ABN8CU41_9STRA|nr:unnamed protein product [Peronospora belbahrii]